MGRLCLINDAANQINNPTSVDRVCRPNSRGQSRLVRPFLPSSGLPLAIRVAEEDTSLSSASDSRRRRRRRFRSLAREETREAGGCRGEGRRRNPEEKRSPLARCDSVVAIRRINDFASATAPGVFSGMPRRLGVEDRRD